MVVTSGAVAQEPGRETVRTFRLESAKGGNPLGPFVRRNDQRLAIADDFFRVETPLDDDIEFVSERTGQRFGPYDFVEGRLVRLGPEMYTLIDIRSIEIPRADRAAPRPAPRPSPPPVIDPLPPLTPPVIDVDIAPIEPPPTAPSGGRQQPAVRTPVRPPPVVPRPRRAPLGIGLGAGVRVFDVSDYDIEANAALEIEPFSRETSISRHGVFAQCSMSVLSLSAGYAFNVETYDSLDTGFVAGDISVAEGSGWWVAADLAVPVWKRDNWSVGLTACAAYRDESVTLEYSGWESAPLLVVGTNEVDETVEPDLAWSFGERERDMSLSEARVDAGAEAAYTSGVWQFHAGLRTLLFSELDGSARIESDDGDIEIEIDRAGSRVTLTAGLRVKATGLTWFGEARAGAENSVSAGFVRQF